MTSSSSGKLQAFHGGEFQRLHNLMYTECECSEVEVDPNLLNVDDTKVIMSKLGYAEDMIQTVYLCKLDLPFENSLVAIKSDAELIGLLTKLEYVCVYVEYIGNEKVEEGGGSNKGNEIEYDVYFIDDDDESTDGV